MASRRFPIRVGRRSAPLLRIFFGVKADTAYVELTDAPDETDAPSGGADVSSADRANAPSGTFLARFGWSTLETPIANIVSWRIEGPWRWITAIGVRRSIRHADVSFGGTPRGGVRVDFRAHPKLGLFHPPALYVTVDDLEGLAAALKDRVIPGEDARTRIVPQIP